MASIKVRQHTGADGILHLEIPTGISEYEVEATVIYQKLAPQEVSPLVSLNVFMASVPTILSF
jgi:hypothetical protein